MLFFAIALVVLIATLFLPPIASIVIAAAFVASLVVDMRLFRQLLSAAYADTDDLPDEYQHDAAARDAYLKYLNACLEYMDSPSLQEALRYNRMPLGSLFLYLRTLWRGERWPYLYPPRFTFNTEPTAQDAS